MKKSVILLFACILSLSAFGQKTYDLPAFTAVASSNSANVVIRIGSTQSVTAKGSSAALGKLILEVKNNSLKIKSKKGTWSKNDGQVVINITMTKLNALACSGSGDVTLEGNFDSSNFAIANSGSGDLTGTGSINTDKLNIANSGSADLTLKGKCQKLSLANSGSGDAALSGLTSQEASVVNSGSGDLEIHCSGKLNAVNTGSGDIQVEGNPEKKSIVNTGSGDINYDRDEQ